MQPFKELTSLKEFKDIDRVQTNIKLFANQFLSIPILNGRLIEEVALSTSEVLVDHKLGRDYKGWIVVDKNAAQDIYVSSTPSKSRYLALTAGGTVTASLWVF